MSKIGISFTPSGGSAFNIIFSDFLDNAIPRSYMGGAQFSQSANGASIISGPAYRDKYIWIIDVLMTKEKALEVDALFRAWDGDRAQGLPAACGVIDQTFGPEVQANAIFGTPPTFTRMSPILVGVSFALNEV